MTEREKLVIGQLAAVLRLSVRVDCVGCMSVYLCVEAKKATERIQRLTTVVPVSVLSI